MAIKVARGQVTIIDQNDAVSIQSFITSNHPLTQLFNKDTGVSTPEWSGAKPLILTPSLYVSSKGTVDQIKTIGDATTLTPGIKPGSALWRKNGTVITGSADNCTITGVGTSYILTISANHMNANNTQVRYTFSATYIDPNGLEIPVSAHIQFTQHQTAGAVLCAIAYAPDGVIFRNNDVPTLRAHCDLWRGATIDDTDVEYAWGIKDSTVFEPTKTTTAVSVGASQIKVSHTHNIEPGAKILIGNEAVTVSSIDPSGYMIYITGKITQVHQTNTPITSIYYHESLGAGWAYLTSTNHRGVSAGWATNEITITADAVLNFDTFKCAIKDKDMSAGNVTGGQVVCDILSFTDISDPIMVDIVSQSGFTIKNGGNNVDAKAILYRAGEEVDAAGTQYTYTWKLWNSAGTAVSKTFTGKSVTVAKTDVTGKAALWCEISS